MFRIFSVSNWLRRVSVLLVSSHHGAREKLNDSLCLELEGWVFRSGRGMRENQGQKIQSVLSSFLVFCCPSPLFFFVPVGLFFLSSLLTCVSSFPCFFSLFVCFLSPSMFSCCRRERKRWRSCFQSAIVNLLSPVVLFHLQSAIIHRQSPIANRQSSVADPES